MRNRPLVQMLVIGAIAVVIGIPIALVIPWFPANASKQAGNVRTLYDVLLIVSVPVFVLVVTVVLYSVWKFRMRPGEENKDGPPIHGNTRLEVVWTAVPAILIVGLCTYAYTVLRSNEDSKKNEITVNVTERQFAFEFSYPEAGGKTVVSPQLYLAKGQPVVFKLRSLDVIHSFFVPDFSVKLDAVPGITTTVRVTPTRLGTYPAECTELCGAGHALMRAPVHVVTPAGVPDAGCSRSRRMRRRRSARRLRTRPSRACPGAGAPAPSTSTTSTSRSASAAPLSASADRRQGHLHRRRGVQRLSHARGRRRDRHGRPQPRHEGRSQREDSAACRSSSSSTNRSSSRTPSSPPASSRTSCPRPSRSR